MKILKLSIASMAVLSLLFVTSCDKGSVAVPVQLGDITLTFTTTTSEIPTKSAGRAVVDVNSLINLRATSLDTTQLIGAENLINLRAKKTEIYIKQSGSSEPNLLKFTPHKLQTVSDMGDEYKSTITKFIPDDSKAPETVFSIHPLDQILLEKNLFNKNTTLNMEGFVQMPPKTDIEIVMILKDVRGELKL